ncbi:hypothetical protein [Nocardia salmonicida]|uniref:hypothetical protein n=1 Tax=Nocardia salmonicida TaxID=53431 RepID=UPI0037B7DD24
MLNRTTLRAAVAATTLGLALAGTGIATATPEAAPIRHGHHKNHPGLLSGSASTGSALAGSAASGSADLAACLLLEVVVPLPVCLLLS